MSNNQVILSLSPFKVYTNLQDICTKISIKKDLKFKSGVYAFVHNYSKKVYIGSSIDLILRITCHLKNINSNI